MSSLLGDKEKKRKLEADFSQYYGARLQDLYDDTSSMDSRWVIIHALQLPPDSRTKKDLYGETLDQNQHLLVDMIDQLNMLTFLNAVQTNASLAKGEFQKVMKTAPKPVARGPEKLLEKKEKPVFISTRELMEKVSKKSGYIAHTESCRNSKVYAETGNCHCPVIET